MRDSDAGLRANLENGGKTAHNLNEPDQVQAHLAPTHCPVCLLKLRIKRTKRLADDGNRRYRYCPAGCYEDRAVLIVEKSQTHETA